MRLKSWALALAALAFGAIESPALDYKEVQIGGQPAVVYRVSMKRDRLQLFLRDDAGQSLKSFDAITQLLAKRKQRLLFGMNGGMYHGNFAPVGLCVIDGKTLEPLNLKDDEGNFFLKPNGVFFTDQVGAHVMEASEFARRTAPVTLATQSGPMLVVNGQIHPKFNVDGPSKLIRNGVGVANPDTAIFVIADGPVNLHTFASYFRDTLKCPNALFFDATVSSLFSAPLNRSDKKMDLGPILGVVEDVP